MQGRVKHFCSNDACNITSFPYYPFLPRSLSLDISLPFNVFPFALLIIVPSPPSLFLRYLIFKVTRLPRNLPDHFPSVDLSIPSLTFHVSHFPTLDTGSILRLISSCPASALCWWHFSFPISLPFSLTFFLLWIWRLHGIFIGLKQRLRNPIE